MRAEKSFVPSEALSPEEAARFLRPFGAGMPEETETLLSYTVPLQYTWEDGYFRRIVRCRVGAGDLVLKVRREEEISLARLSSQCAFSEYLAEHGIQTARFLPVCASREGAWEKAGFAAGLPAAGGPVLVTVERFCNGQLTQITPELAEAAGRLLARMHNISERGGCHIEGRVLFDPFEENDLFSLEGFEAFLPSLSGENRRLAEAVAARGRALLARLAPFRSLPRCAVQGDLADCNLFLTPEGELGVFDFNNCGDNAPYLDAVMHSVYISRLMEYGRPADEALSEELYARFWRGYTAVRPLSLQEDAAREEFARLICAFWKFDLLFREDSFAALLKAGDEEGLSLRLARMKQKLDGKGVFA